VKLQVRGVSFAYNGTDVLKDVSLEFGASGVTGIIGPNGSGKTTLLKCLDRLLKPRVGSIMLGEKDLEHFHQQELAQSVGYVPQSEGRGFPRTVFDTVLMGRRPHISWGPSRKDLEKVSGIIGLLGLGELAQRDVWKLSGGQRQKVVIARALAQEPKLLLLDEPTASLDLKHQLEVMELIHQQAQNGISAIISIHDLNLAARYCDTIIMLREGGVFAAGGKEVLTPHNIREVYGVEASVLEHQGRVVVVPEG
jgi:iron complex transport system ATP-binding protein